MNKELSERQRNIARHIYRDDSEMADKIINFQNSDPESDEICNRINDEFLLNGLSADCESNEYGEELEDLLDIINRPQLDRTANTLKFGGRDT
jgi:hypothetical protein